MFLKTCLTNNINYSMCVCGWCLSNHIICTGLKFIHASVTITHFLRVKKCVISRQLQRVGKYSNFNGGLIGNLPRIINNSYILCSQQVT